MPRKQKVNRAEQVSEKNKNYDFNVDLYSIDEAVKYYIDNVIMPKVHTIDEELDVPVIYASMERWSNIQKTQYIRNDKNKVMCPIIAYKRTGVEKNSDISVSKIDANKPQIHYFRKQKFNNKFRYNKFNLLHDQRRPEEIISMVVPEYVILSYDMIF